MSTLVATAMTTGVLWAQRLPGPTIESPEEGSPGFAGFVATFLLAAAVIVLAVSFTRRMRRADHRERVRERSAEPIEGADDGASGREAGTATAAGDDPSHVPGAAGEPGTAPDANLR